MHRGLPGLHLHSGGIFVRLNEAWEVLRSDCPAIHSDVLQRDAIHTAFLIEPLDGTERQPTFVTKEVDMLDADILDISAGCIIGAYLPINYPNDFSYYCLSHHAHI